MTYLKEKKQEIRNKEVQKQSCFWPAAYFLESSVTGGLLCHLHVEQVDA